MQQAFEFFKGKYELRGKHARMADELCSVRDVDNNYFKRVVDVCILAALIGYRFDRKAPQDNSADDSKSIFPDVMLKEKDNFDFILQMILILENAKSMNHKDSILRAFRGAQNREEYEAYDALFQDYVRGGIEELYERLVIRKPDPDAPYGDERTDNLLELLELLRE